MSSPGERVIGRRAVMAGFIVAIPLTLIGYLLFDALQEETPAGQPICAGLALAAVAALLASYAARLRVGLLAYRDESRRDLVRRGIGRHIALMLATPLVVMATHPWGMVSLPVAMVIPPLGQMLFLHVGLVMSLRERRRKRRAAA